MMELTTRRLGLGMHTRFLRIVPAALAALFLAWPAVAQWNSSAVAPAPEKSIAVESLRLGAGDASTLVRLDSIDAAAIESVREANSQTFAKRLPIGLGREARPGDPPRAGAL